MGEGEGEDPNPHSNPNPDAYPNPDRNPKPNPKSTLTATLPPTLPLHVRRSGQYIRSIQQPSGHAVSLLALGPHGDVLLYAAKDNSLHSFTCNHRQVWHNVPSPSPYHK